MVNVRKRGKVYEYSFDVAKIEGKRKRISKSGFKTKAKALKQGTIEITKESERAIVDIETLQKTNQDIIDTLDEVIRIHEEGRQKRKSAELELKKIEDDLKEKLLDIKSQD